jgi:hypothetical protein
VLTASLILAAVAAGATAVIYGTDIFCALVWCPSLAGLDNAALARSAGAVHRYGDARLPPVGATGIAAATASAITAALDGHPAGAALAGAAVVALLAWLAVYLRVSAPVNCVLISAAAEAAPVVDARALQRRWNSVIGVRVALQAAALALLLVTLVAHV